MIDRDLARATAYCEICALLWGAFLLGGCAYIVFWLDRSPWWFVLAIFLFVLWKCPYGRNKD